MRCPFLLRSSWLVKAFEPAIGQWRQFYWGSTREFNQPGLSRVGLYEPGADNPSWLYGRPFQSTPEGRRELIKSLMKWTQHDFGSSTLRVLSDDRDPRYQAIGNGSMSRESKVASSLSVNTDTTFRRVNSSLTIILLKAWHSSQSYDHTQQPYSRRWRSVCHHCRIAFAARRIPHHDWHRCTPANRFRCN